MKLASLTLALGLGGLLAGCDQMPLNAADKPPAPAATAVSDTSPVLATVNGSPITEGVVEIYEQQLSARRAGNAAGQYRKAILEEIIYMELASQGCETQGLD